MSIENEQKSLQSTNFFLLARKPLINQIRTKPKKLQVPMHFLSSLSLNKYSPLFKSKPFPLEKTKIDYDKISENLFTKNDTQKKKIYILKLDINSLSDQEQNYILTKQKTPQNKHTKYHSTLSQSSKLESKLNIPTEPNENENNIQINQSCINNLSRPPSHKKLMNTTNTNQRRSFDKISTLPPIKQGGSNISPCVYNKEGRFSAMSLAGKYNTKSIDKINQDRILAMEHILNLDDFSMYCVFDGHGQNGHFISEMAKNHFISFFSDSTIYYIPRFKQERKVKSLKNYINSNTIYEKLTSKNFQLIKRSIKSLQEKVNKSDYEIDFSGTTVCSVFLCENHAICVNVGDSRAIVITKESEIPLSNDHKPSIKGERKRIEESGGEVKRSDLVNDGPFRVWVKGEEFPGIAMSRSIGDNVAKAIGVCCEPGIIDIRIDKDCIGIVVASDGVWEFLSNKTIGELFRQGYKERDVDKTCRRICEEARKSFMKREYVDDISAICVFVNQDD